MNQLPAFLQNRPSRNLAQTAIANLGVGSPPYLSIMGNRLALIDAVGEEIPVQTYDPKTGPYIDVVLIDLLERTSKIYYDKAFDPGAQQYEPPACFSDNGVGPSRNAAKPQSPTCASCPQSAWGSKVSAVSGKGVKACADIQKTAFIVAGYDMPFLLRVPPNSRTNLRNYLHKFQGQQVDVPNVITRVSFEQGAIGTLKFDAVNYIDETMFGQSEKLLMAKATDAMLGRTDMPRQDALPAPAQPAPLPLQAPQVQQPAPFVPSAPVVSAGAPLASNATSAAPALVPVQPEQQATQRRRRRTNAEMQAAQGQAAAQPLTQAPAAPQAAPFMPPTAAPSAAPSNGAFGIAAGAAPNPELAQVLDGLFAKK